MGPTQGVDEMANCAHYEPPIDEILADPAVKALMLADGVNPSRLRNKLLRLEAANGKAEPLTPRRGAGLSMLSGARRGEATARAVWG